MTKLKNKEVVATEVQVETATPKKKRKVNKNSLQLYLMCAFPMLFVFVFNYIPLVGLVIAFQDYRFDKGMFGSDFVGLDNILFFIKSGDFMKITRNTLVLNFMFIVVGVIAAVALAVLLFEVTSRKLVKVFQTIYIMPNFLSWVVVGCLAYAFLNPSYGMFNAIITKMGGTPLQWYSQPMAKWWPLILLVVSVWKHVGMDSIIYYAALMGVDKSLIEAAQIDGATKWKIIMNIYVPTITPIITILTINKIGAIFRADFGLFFQVTRDSGGLFETTDVIDTYSYRTMRVFADYGTSAAIGLMQSIVGFVMVVTTNAIVKKIDPQNSLF